MQARQKRLSAASGRIQEEFRQASVPGQSGTLATRAISCAPKAELIPIDSFLFLLAAGIAANLVALALFGADKQRARCRRRRIRERTLLLAAFAAPFGALTGMRLFRHKTQKPLFSVGVPLVAALHVLVVALLVVAP